MTPEESVLRDSIAKHQRQLVALRLQTIEIEPDETDLLLTVFHLDRIASALERISQHGLAVIQDRP